MDELLYETRDGVTVITLNRPAQLNAMNTAMREGLRAAWGRFEADAEARVAILTAAGDRAFCAGRDLKEAAVATSGVIPRDYIPILGDSVHVSKPVIAAVHGHALGAGFLLVQMCDLCVASETATFGVAEVKMGRGVPWAVPLSRMIPYKVMLELLMTSATISARRAHEIGLVNHVVPPDQVMAKALEMARLIIASAPLSVAATRRMAQVTLEHGRAEALDRAYEIFRSVYESEDAREGARAFVEKRAPVWKGR
jgi:enoyl-CoA hydratase/carnithine racemase